MWHSKINPDKKKSALADLECMVKNNQSAEVITQYEIAAWAVDASVEETEAITCKHPRFDRGMVR